MPLESFHALSFPDLARIRPDRLGIVIKVLVLGETSANKQLTPRPRIELLAFAKSLNPGLNSNQSKLCKNASKIPIPPISLYRVRRQDVAQEIEGN